MSDNIFVDMLDHFLDEANVRDPNKYLHGRVTNGKAFETEAQLRTQYCNGGLFVEGWIGNMKVRMYGRLYGGWDLYFGHISEAIDESTDTLHHATGGLPRQSWKEDILEVVEEKLKHFMTVIDK